MTAAPTETSSESYNDLGLNIVFGEPSSNGLGSDDINGGATGRSSKKPKRKTKYDRRREKSRQAKLAKQSGDAELLGNNASSNPKLAPKNIKRIGGNYGAVSGGREEKDKPDKSASPMQKPINEEENISNNREQNSTNATRAGSEIINEGKSEPSRSEAHDKQFLRAKQPTKAGSTNLKNYIDSDLPKSALAAVAESFSRRTRVQIPITDENKSRYLSEFHARPRDLDRSERASTEIKPSSTSDHIFSTEVDDDSDGEKIGTVNGEDSNNSGNERHSDKVGENNERIDATKDGPFEKIGLHKNLINTLTSESGPFHLTQPTVVQSRAIACLLGGNKKQAKKKKIGKLEENLFIQSETGSGKTLAYLLPVLQHLAVDSKTQNLKRVDRQLGGTRAIILTPTRELATQTYTTANNLCSKAFPWIVPGCFSGGEKRKSEKARLRKGISILIATPGRLLDHVCKTESLLSALKGKLEWLVLDEADRLLDAGLGGQVEQIVQHLRSNQPGAGPRKDGVSWRSILVSATVTGELEGLAKTALGGDGWMWARGHGKGEGRFAKSLDGNGDDADTSKTESHYELDNSAPRQLAQLYMVVSAKLRLSSLVAFLAARASKGERTVVFLSTCDSVDYHHALFTSLDSILPQDEKDEADSNESKGIFGKHCPIYKLHGDIPHAQRSSIMKSFSGECNNKTANHHSAILLATDVAARGLNFPALDWIVQYDPPCETKDYVHRAGRSARAGQAGHALLFLLPSERQYVEVLQLRGLKDISALSLSATLTSAADLCPGVTHEGEAKAAGNTYSDGRGEAFTNAIQNRLEQCVQQDDENFKAAMEKKVKDPKQRRKSRKDSAGPLLEGARKAFSAFVRAYPAKEKAVRHIFNARGLHLGHIARSLALKETPKMVSKVNNGNSSVRLENGKGKDASGSKTKDARGEKRNARLAFDATKEKGDVAIEDAESEKYLSLLGDALGESNSNKAKQASKKMKVTNNPADAKQRMMRAAELLASSQGGMEFM